MSALNVTNSRSRRSQPSFADLRLKPLSPAFQGHVADGIEDSHPTSLDQISHPSYLTGRSAPPTPGNRRSDRLHHGGLSRKGSIYDADENENVPPTLQPREEGDTYFAYSAVSDSSDQLPSPFGDRPKAKSEMALLARSHDTKLTSARVYANAYTSDRTFTQSGRTTPKHAQHAQPHADSWLTHAGAYTSALLAETKGQSWMNLHAATSTNLLSHADDSDSDSERPHPHRAKTTSGISRIRSGVHISAHHDLLTSLHENTELAQASANPLASPWGSRFGSRAASARTSRRNSKTSLAHLHLNTNHTHLSSGMPGALAGLPNGGGLSATATGVGGMTLTQPSPDNQVLDLDGSGVLLSSPEDRPRNSSSKLYSGLRDGRGMGYAGYKPDFINLSDKRDIAAAKALGMQSPTGTYGSGVDGVDIRDVDDQDEKEIERWMKSQNKLLGMGGALVDRLLGIGGSGSAAGTADVGEHNKKQVADGMADGVSMSRVSEKSNGQDQGVGKTEEPGAWADARYLLGLASKVLL